MKNIGILIDSNPAVGGGHFWRCFNLCKSLKNKDIKFHFLSNCLTNDLNIQLKKNCFSYHKIKNLYKSDEIINKIKKTKISILITDIYNLSSFQKRKIKKYVNLLIVIDDFCHKIHNSDIYINNNFIKKSSIKKIKKLNPNTKLFLGPKYIIINKKFFVKKNRIFTKNKIKTIFCFFGSSDPSDDTSKFLDTVKDYKNIKINVLIGPTNKNYKKIKKNFKKKKNIKILFNLPNESIFYIIKKSDFSIGSGGVNMLERLFLRIPSIVICNADNQINAIRELNKRKLIIYLGTNKKIKKTNIGNIVNHLLNNENKLRNITRRLNTYFNNFEKEYLLSKKLGLIINGLNSKKINV